MLKELLGLEPVATGDNTYSPAPGVLKVMVNDQSGYKKKSYDAKYTGDKKVLVVCTEQDRMEMKNGKNFLTGNHPVETFVPLMHLHSAGFQFEFATPSGKPVAMEQWAYPRKDPEFAAFAESLKPSMDKPRAMADAESQLGNGGYLAVFIPGGHGALLGLPHDKHLGNILKTAHAQRLHIISICHGPAAFLAAAEDAADEHFLFNGYAIAAFPDRMDKQLPTFGYLPGPMPWYFGKRLEALGTDIVNGLATGKTHVDRKLITGDSPMAADKLGQLATEALLKEQGDS